MAQSLSEQEKATNYETLAHIQQVQKLLHQIVIELLHRAEQHDATKLEAPELSVFVEYTPKLAHSEYGSEEYQRFLHDMRPALEHHYAHNRHHPEHFPAGVNDMTLMDLIEMVCDWIAATRRQHTGDIEKSLEKSRERFGLSEQFIRILRNTVNFLQKDA